MRKNYLLLNVKAAHPIPSPRVANLKKVSAKRFHHQIKISSSSDLDKELLGWLKEAYNKSG